MKTNPKTERTKGSGPCNNGIRMVFIDVDGVLTDGSMYYSENGELLKCFNARDGMGFELIRLNNIIPVILTKENSKIVLSRAAKLLVEEVHIGITNKLTKGLEIMGRYSLNPHEVACIGDDINDIGLMEVVSCSWCPADAEDEVKRVATHICTRAGGKGAFREMVNWIVQSGTV